MVIARIENLPLEDGVTHIATDWQISDQQSFATRVLESMNDTRNVSAIIFNEVLDPNIKWYGRARARLSTGYTVWGNIDIFRPENDNVIDASEDLPSRVGVPVVTTSASQSNHDVTMFTISASGFEVLGNATLSSTSWIIEDICGNVIWSSLYNNIDKTSIDVNSVILDSNTIYRIKVMFHSTSNDASPIGVYTIKTANNDDINLITYLDWVSVGKPINLRMYKLEGVTTVTWSIISMAGQYAQEIWTETTNTPNEYTVEMPTTSLKSDQLYILKIATNNNTIGSKFIPFRTRVFEEETNPDLIVPDEIEDYDISKNKPYLSKTSLTRCPTSKISGPEIAILENIEGLEFTYKVGDATTFETYDQELVVDLWNNLLNGKTAWLNDQKKLTYEKAVELKIPLLKLSKMYKDNYKFDMLPLTDDNGGKVLRGSAQYTTKEGLSGNAAKVNCLVTCLLNEDDTMVNDVFTEPNLIPIEKDNETYYALVLRDGIHSRPMIHEDVFGMYTEEFVTNRKYKLAIVDIEDKKKLLIPFTVVKLSSRKREDFIHFGICKPDADFATIYGNGKTLTNVSLTKDQEADFRITVLNNVLGEIRGNDKVEVKSCALWNITDTAGSDEAFVKAMTKVGLVNEKAQIGNRTLLNIGKLVLVGKQVGRFELNLVSEGGETITISGTVAEAPAAPSTPPTENQGQQGQTDY